MATVQEMAQATQAVIPNNGNPNTVYNNAGYQIPQSPWTTNTIRPAANYTPNAGGPLPTLSNQRVDYTQGGGGWTAPANSPTVDGTINQYLNPTVPTGWGGGATTNPTQPSQPTGPTQPQTPDTSNFQWVVMNGKIPGKNQQLYDNDPRYKAAWDQAVKEHESQFKKGYNEDSGVDAIENRLKQLYTQLNGVAPTTPVTGGGGSGGSWTGGIPYDGSQDKLNAYAKEINNIVSSGNVTVNTNRGWAQGTAGDESKLGAALNATVDKWSASLAGLGQNVTSSNFMQFMDAVTEPLLPGNLYMSELGAMNTANVAYAIMNRTFPGLGSVVSKIAKAIPENAPSWLQSVKNFFLEGDFQQAANAIYKQLDEETKTGLANKPFSVGGGGGYDSGFSIRPGAGGMGGWGSGVPISNLNDPFRKGIVTVGAK